MATGELSRLSALFNVVKVFEHIDMQLLAACLIQPECAVKIFTCLRLEKRIQKSFMRFIYCRAY